jgi:hypothetical protein
MPDLLPDLSLEYFHELFKVLGLYKKYPFISKNGKKFIDYMIWSTRSNSAYQNSATLFQEVADVSKHTIKNLGIEEFIKTLDGPLYRFNVFSRYSSEDYLIGKFVSDFCGLELDKILSKCEEMVINIKFKTCSLSLESHMMFLLAEVFVIFKLVIETECLDLLYKSSNKVFEFVQECLDQKADPNNFITQNPTKYWFDKEMPKKYNSKNEYQQIVFKTIYHQMKKFHELMENEINMMKITNIYPEFQIMFCTEENKFNFDIDDYSSLRRGHRCFYFLYVLANMIDAPVIKEFNHFIIPIHQLESVNSDITIEI